MTNKRELCTRDPWCTLAPDHVGICISVAKIDHAPTNYLPTVRSPSFEAQLKGRYRK